MKVLILFLLVMQPSYALDPQPSATPEKSWGTVGRAVGEAVVGAIVGEAVRAGADRMRTPSAHTPSPSPSPRPAPTPGNGRDPHHGNDPAPVGHPSARL